MRIRFGWLALAALCLTGRQAWTQPPASQARPASQPDTASQREAREDPRVAPSRHENEGPFPRLIIRGTTLIDGTGGPPRGPVDIVIENNRITNVASVGYPGVPSDTGGRPKNATREIDGSGMFVMPVIVDLHVHQGTKQKAPESEYYNKLWLAHGITMVENQRKKMPTTTEDAAGPPRAPDPR